MTKQNVFNGFVAGWCAYAAFVNALDGGAWFCLVMTAFASLNLYLAFRRSNRPPWRIRGNKAREAN